MGLVAQVVGMSMPLWVCVCGSRPPSPPAPPCFLVFVFSRPPAPSDPPGRPLTERSKTHRPAAIYADLTAAAVAPAAPAETLKHAILTFSSGYDKLRAAKAQHLHAERTPSPSPTHARWGSMIWGSMRGGRSAQQQQHGIHYNYNRGRPAGGRSGLHPRFGGPCRRTTRRRGRPILQDLRVTSRADPVLISAWNSTAQRPRSRSDLGASHKSLRPYACRSQTAPETR